MSALPSTTGAERTVITGFDGVVVSHVGPDRSLPYVVRQSVTASSAIAVSATVNNVSSMASDVNISPLAR